MPGAFTDFDFLMANGKTNVSTAFLLSIDFKKNGLKSLKGDIWLNGGNMTILHKTNTSHANGNRFTLWIYHHNCPAGDWNRHGAIYGVDISGANVVEGLVGYLFNNANTATLRIDYFSATGTPTNITNKVIADLVADNWYFLEFIVSVVGGVAYGTLNIYDTDGTTLIDSIVGNRNTASFGTKYGIYISAEDVHGYCDDLDVFE